MTTKRLTPEDRRALEYWEQYYTNIRNAAVVDLNESPTEIEARKRRRKVILEAVSIGCVATILLN